MSEILSPTSRATGSPSLRRALLWFAAAFLSVAAESVTALDRLAQAPFFRDGAWLISRKFHESHKLLAYTAPKIIIVSAGLALLAVFILASIRCPLKARLKKWKGPALAAVLSLALVPLAVAALKSSTGVYGPFDLAVYGGSRPHVGYFGALLGSGATSGGGSFPAGHASGGFALSSLGALPTRRNLQRALFWLGILAGWAMGIYQMARGEHFLTHTLTTMFLALGIINFLQRLILKPMTP
ncbi:MAG: phosphatase PAP2 family protein [Deltaproteobacteria bacterium]|jgi:membrane-associated PAP2 superfamily phosphatase|nr:phosphatase PAP2 family protein [Deltaproteobacteria bacterium]